MSVVNLVILLGNVAYVLAHEAWEVDEDGALVLIDAVEVQVMGMAAGVFV